MVKNPKKWIDVRKGQLFKVVKNSNGHNYPMNTPLKVEYTPSALSGQIIEGYNNLDIRDVVFLNYSLEGLIEYEKELKEELKEVSDKISFMKERDLTDLDVNIYEAHKIMQKLKNKETEQAVKLLAKILESKKI